MKITLRLHINVRLEIIEWIGWLILCIGISFNFLLGFEFRQFSQIFPSQHGLIFIELEIVGSFDSLGNLFWFGDMQSNPQRHT